MEDMAMDILATPDTTDTHMPTVCTMASARLMLTPTCMEDMDILAMLDTTDTPMPTMDLPTTERDLLMPSPRLMLTPTFCTEDMDMDTLDTVDTTDTHMVDMPTTISYNTKAISCYRKLTKLPSMSSSSVTTFFSAWTQFWVVQQETKRIKI